MNTLLQQYQAVRQHSIQTLGVDITYRNFFHAPLRWQYTGVRLAEHI